ncbi:hypothetical protein VWM73_11710, partial [Campylobacter coli]
MKKERKILLFLLLKKAIVWVKITSKINGDLNFVESKVTKEIENALSEIDGVKTITSTAYDN